MSLRTLSVWSGELAEGENGVAVRYNLKGGILFAMSRTKPIAARQEETNFDCHF
jgi:hypothetical protein